MKKKSKFAFVTAFIIIISCGFGLNQKSHLMPDLVLANIEAMALNDEVDMNCNDCYSIYGAMHCKDWGWGGCTGFYFHRN